MNGEQRKTEKKRCISCNKEFYPKDHEKEYADMVSKGMPNRLIYVIRLSREVGEVCMECRAQMGWEEAQRKKQKRTDQKVEKPDR